MIDLDATELLHSMISICSFIILGIALVGVATQKNLFKIFLSFAIAEAGLFLFFIGNHFEISKIAPIVEKNTVHLAEDFTDPVPHAMILTTIVIAIAVLGLALSYVKSYYRLTNNLNIDAMDEFGDDK